MSAVFLLKTGDTPYGTESVPGSASKPSSYSTVTDISPTVLTEVSNGQIGELHGYANTQAEVAWNNYPRDTAIRCYDNTDPDNTVLMFDGVIVKRHMKITGSESIFDFCAYNNGDWLLNRTILHGQYRLNHSNEQSYFTAGVGSTITIDFDSGDLLPIDTPLCFNVGGQPNMLPQPYKDTGIGPVAFKVFDAPFRNQVNNSGAPIAAVPWTLKDAVTYVLLTADMSWAIDISTFTDAVAAINFNNPQLGEVNCEGATVAEALRRLLEPYNYTYRTYLSYSGESPTYLYGISIINKDDPDNDLRTLTLPPPPGVSSSSSGSNPSLNAVDIDLMDDGSAIVNCLDAYGEQIIQTTLAHTNPPAPSGSNPPVMKLYKAWRDADLVWAYETDGTTVNPWDTTFRRNYCNDDLISIIGGKYIYGVGRLWMVNVQGEIPNQNLENLNADLVTPSSMCSSSSAGGAGGPQFNSTDTRRLEKSQFYNKSEAGGLLKQADVVVEYSTDSGTTWGIMEKHWYQILPDGMGIVFTNSKSLEMLGYKVINAAAPNGISYWQALSAGSLQLRVVCSVKSDARVNAGVPNDGSRSALATERQWENQGYRKSWMNPLVSDSIIYTQYEPYFNNQDNSCELLDALQQTFAVTNRTMYAATFAILYGSWEDYVVQDQITGIVNRAITFPSGNYPVIVKAQYDLQNLHVQLMCDNHRVPPPIHQKPITAQTYRERQLGIGELEQFKGGHQVPFAPGNDKDRIHSLLYGKGTYQFGSEGSEGAD